MVTCVCRHGEAQHGIGPILGEQDGRTITVGWEPVDGTRCVWTDYPELNVNPQKGQPARPCGCTGFTSKEDS